MCLTMRTLIVAGLFSGSLFSGGVAAGATFQQVAVEFTNNIGSMNVNMPVALSDDGKVAFLASYQVNDGTAPQRIFTVNGGVVGNIDLPGMNYAVVRSL